MRINEFNESQQLCPECGGPAFSDLMLAEKQDACYNKVKSRYKVWPSAYASGALVQCRKKGAANWGNKSKNEDVAEGEVVQFPKKHKGDLEGFDDCPKCGGDLMGGTYMGHRVKVCNPCKQVYLPPNSGIDQKGNKIDEYGDTARGQKMLTKVQKRAVDRVTSKKADTDPAYAKKNSDTAKRAWERMTDTDVSEGANDTIYPNAEVIKSKNGKPVGEIYQDASGWGCHHYAADLGADCIESREEAVEWLKDLNDEHRQDRSLREGDFTKTPSGDYRNMHTGRTSSTAPAQKKKRGEKTGAEWDAIEKAKKDKEQGVAEGSVDHRALGKHHEEMTDQELRKVGSKLPDSWDAAVFRRKLASHPKYAQALKHYDKSEYHFGKAARQGVAEEYNAEYDDEAGMAQGSLHTLKNAVEGLQDVIDAGDNLPEWCQEKISLAEDYLVTVWDYIQSEKAQGVDPEISEEFDLVESIIDRIAAQNGVDAEMVWEDLESLSDDELYAFAVTSQLNEDWSKVNKRDKTDGMSQKAVNAYRREHPGSKLKTAVTTKPSKLKKGSKASKRRKSYCSRSRGQMKMHNISCAKTPDKAICKARRRWNC